MGSLLRSAAHYIHWSPTPIKAANEVGPIAPVKIPLKPHHGTDVMPFSLEAPENFFGKLFVFTLLSIMAI